MINEQINKEYFSAYLYLSISSRMLDLGLCGFAHWYEVQAREECDHAMRFYRFLHDEGLGVTLLPIAAPQCQCVCPADMLREALEHEEFVTESINHICRHAEEIHDRRVMQFLDWFVAEQAEEEANARDMLAKLRLYGENPASLFLLDCQLAKRE